MSITIIIEEEYLRDIHAQSMIQNRSMDDEAGGRKIISKFI